MIWHHFVEEDSHVSGLTLEGILCNFLTWHLKQLIDQRIGLITSLESWGAFGNTLPQTILVHQVQVQFGLKSYGKTLIFSNLFNCLFMGFWFYLMFLILIEVLFKYGKGLISYGYNLMIIHKLTAVDEGTTISPHAPYYSFQSPQGRMMLLLNFKICYFGSSFVFLNYVVFEMRVLLSFMFHKIISDYSIINRNVGKSRIKELPNGSY